MPLYKYRCSNCGYEFTILHSMNEKPDITCELCGGKAEKMIGKVGISFKGSGFYVTDSKKGNSNSTLKDNKNETSNEKVTN